MNLFFIQGRTGALPHRVLVAALLFAIAVNCDGQTVTVTAPQPTPYAIVSDGPDWDVWQSTNYEVLPSGQIIPHIRSHEERATGLNFLDPATGAFEPAKEEIDLLQDGSGAAATNGQIQVYFPNDLATGVIRVITPAPESLVLESRPVSIGYSDSTNYIEIASITNALGSLIATNEVLYQGGLAGHGITCDIFFVYRKSGLEQDVIFRSRPPAPEQFGLNSANTRLQVSTEFFNSPAPSQTAEPVNPQAGLADSTLSFGRSKMIQGRAFLAGDSDSAQIPTFKTWVNIDQTTSALIEQVPYSQVSGSLATLPLVASADVPLPHPPSPGSGAASGRGSVEMAKSGPLPHGRGSVANDKRSFWRGVLGRRPQIATNVVHMSKAQIGQKPGFCFDYIQITGDETNFVFRGDEAYFVSSAYHLFGKTTIESGTIVKMNNGGQLNIDPNGTVDCQTQPYKPAIFTSYNENDVGDWWGSGSPAMGDVQTFLNFNSTNVLLHDLDFAYASNAVTQTTPGSAGSISLWDCEFVDVATAVSAYNIKLYNVLIGRNAITNAAVIVEGSSLLGENVTADYGSAFIQATNSGTTIALTNCLITSQQLLTTNSSVTLQTNAVVCQPTLSGTVYAPTGGGSYYLTNGSQFVGTANIDPDLLGDLQEKTVWPPIVYANTNISSLGSLNQVARDTNSNPMIGFHYCPLDAVFGGCQLTNTLSISAGTAIGWFEENGPVNISGQPYAVALGNGANLVFNGTATEPCYLAQYAMVQERGTNNWNSYSGGLAPLTFNGSSSSQEPLLSASFTRFIWDDSKEILNDNSAYGAGIFKDCEFYNLGMSSRGIQYLTFTNCLFVRPNFDFWGSTRALNFTNENCTYYDGGLALSRLSGQNAFWSIENTIFDGTLVAYNDYYNGGAGYTFSEFNAYNTNNLSWQTYGFPYGNWTITNSFEGVDASDVLVTNLNWESGWFGGDFYLPTNSPVIEAGSTNANLLGLYHFTSVTNDNPPIVEGINKVNIGYAFVATDTNGNPLSTPGDGIADYLADTNGNGIDDPGETPWDIGFQSEPQSTNVAQGLNVTFSATVGGIGPFTYQWLQNSNQIAGATNLAYTIYVVSPTNDGNVYSIIASNLDGHVESTNAILWVSTPVVLSGGPSDETVASGGSASFTVTNSSGNHLFYQWYTNGVPLENGGRIGGVNNSNLTISSVQPSDGNGYYVVVSNAFNSLPSSTAWLTVITNAVISGISTNTNAIQSEDVTFTVSDSGEQTNQWYFSNIVYSTSAYMIPGATQPSYTQLVVQPTNDGEYYVEASNLAGSTNAGALLNVLVPPWITSQPVSVTNNQGLNATFSITAIGTTSLGYQWFMNGTNSITWATSSILTLTNVGGTNAGGYTCVVTNIAGTNTSAWAWLSANISGQGITNGWGTNSSAPSTGLTVAMYSPTNASPTIPFVWLYGNPISIRAAATSQYGYVTNVAFYYTGTNSGPSSFMLAGNAVPGPNGLFALAWTNAIPGTNILEAVAQDYDGQSATSSIAYVIMAVAPGFNRAPDTNLVWTEGMGGTNIVLTAVVTNDGQPFNSTIHYYWYTNQPNVTIANTNLASTEVTFGTNNTFYVYLAVNNGYATNIQTTTIKIIRHPLLYFTNSAFVTGTPVVLSATAIAYDGAITNVYFTNSTFLGPGLQSVNNSYTYYWQNPPLWTNEVWAIASCSDGLSSTAAASVAIHPPLAVQFKTPTNGQLFLFSPTNIVLQASTASYVTSEVTSVVFTNLTQSIGLGSGALATNSQSQVIWYDDWMGVTNGTYKVTVTAYDNFGNVATDAVTFTNNAMPVVNFVAPTNLQQYGEVANVAIEVTATDIDDNISSVQIFAVTNTPSGTYTNVLLGTAIAMGTNYDFTWTNRYAGPYAVVAVATDNRGSSASTGNIFIVTPTNGSPFCEITGPTNNGVFADGADITITANAYAANGSGPVTNAEFFVNGVDVGGCAEPPYSITKCCWDPGTYELAAIARDTFGSYGVSSNIQITVLQDRASGYWDPTYFAAFYAYPLAVSTDGTFYGMGWDSGPTNNDGTIFKSTDDGRSWQLINDNTTDENYALIADGTNVYAGGNGITITNSTGTTNVPVAVWNGSSWAAVGDPSNDPYNFFSAGEAVPITLAKVNGTLYVGLNGGTNVVYGFNVISNEWIPVGNGFPGIEYEDVYAIASLNNVLYIGGSFTSAGGDTNANYIARLINNTWTNVGSGIAPFSGVDVLDDASNSVFNYVSSLSACGTNLFVGGCFNTAGGATNAYGVAIWDDQNWETLNGGVAPSPVPDPDSGLYGGGDNFPVVNSVLAHGNSVFVGGPFTNVFDGQTTIPANGIAMVTWDKSSQTWTWAALDGGVNPINIGAMVVVPGASPSNYDLYVTSDPTFPPLTSAGSSEIPEGGLARWRIGYSYPTNLPTVTITNPASGISVSLPTNITVNAVAFSSIGIASVELYANGQDKGGGSPNGAGSYSFTFSPGTVGIYQLIAVAKDSNGVVAASKPIILDVKGATNPITAANLQYSIRQSSPPVNFYVLTNCLPTNGLFVSQVQESAFTGTRYYAVFNSNGQAVAQAPLNATPGLPTVSFNGKYITYTAQPGAYGSDFFYYTVTNGSGASDSASVTVNIYPVPQIVITNPVDILESSASTSGVFSLVVAGYSFETGGTVTNVSLYVNGALFGQTSNTNFSFNWSTTGSGVYSLVAVATDQNGITNASQPDTVVVTVFSGGGSTSTNQLVGTITNLVDTYDNLGDQVLPVVTTGIFDLRGQARSSPGGPSFPVAYQVILCTSDGNDTPIANLTPQPDAQGFHEGGDNSGDLGLIDLSTVENGVYDLQLNVYGGGTETNNIPPVRFTLNSRCKVGQFTFSEQDLNLPVNGIPITVTRTYNSQNPNSADFGYGWTFAMNSMNVQLDEQRQNVVLGGPQAPYEDSNDNGNPDVLSVRTGGNWDVTLTLPNGQTTTFDFDPQYIPDPFGVGYVQPEWSAPPWVHAMLTNLDLNDVIEAIPTQPPFWTASDESFFNAPFQNQDFPGWKLITLPDKTEYHITRQFEDDLLYLPDPSQQVGTAQVYGPPTLTEIVERTGDQIFISPDKIYHKDPNGNTSDTVTFTRDGEGRITSISDPNAGTNGLPLVQYVYDQDNGNLIRVLKLLDRNAGTYATTTYDYNNPNLPHYITSIENPNGAPVTRNSYDPSGRLSQTEDANNNITRYLYGPTGTNFEQVVDPLGRTNTFVYDTSGNVTAETNALCQVTLMGYDQYNNNTNEIKFMNGQPYATNSSSYDGNGDLLSATDPLGNTNGFTYNNFGEAITITDARGNTTSNSFDGYGELTSISDALTNTTLNSYSDGQMSSSTSPIGTTTTNYYDLNGNLTSSATLDYPSGAILSSNSYTYDANNNQLTSTGWRKVNSIWTPATTVCAYDAKSRVIQTVNSDGGTNVTVYNLAGQEQATIDALGDMISNTYDPDGHLVQILYPDGTTMSSAYDGAGNLTNSIDQSGRTTTYVYDALNRLIETIYPDGTTNATVYDDLGRVSESIDARGTITAYGYNAAGQRVAVTNAFGIMGVQNVSTYGYDVGGNQITLTDPDGRTTTNIYDVLNRRVQVQYPDGTTTETIYDRDGRGVARINQDGVTSEFGYDGAGRLTSVTNALNQVTRYQYDEAGDEVTQIDALLRTNSYAYDGMGRRTGHTMPGGQSEGFAYDLNGDQHYHTNFDGTVVTNLYDVDNQLTNTSSVFGYNVSFAYSATGQRTNMMDSTGHTTYAYDFRDRLLQKTEYWNGGPTNLLNYGYDANGNVTNIASATPNGVNLMYEYDPLNRLTNVLDNGSAIAGYSYDSAGNLQGMRYGNGVTNQYQHDSMNRLTNLVWGAHNSSLASFYYRLGSAGTRTNLIESLNGTTRTFQWQFDSLYRLTNENVSTLGSLAYAYDSVGNRLSRLSGGSQMPSLVPSDSYSYNTNDWLGTDRYDDNGNTVSSSGTNYQYDVMNQTTNATVNGNHILISYDGVGNRVSKTVGGTTTYYLVSGFNPSGYGQVFEEYRGSILTNVYNYGLRLISQRQPSVSTNYFIYDGQGSTRILADNGGAVVNAFVYDAYGNLIASNGLPQTACLYAGQQFDIDLGLYYNRARYLNTGTGRFWTSDSIDGDGEDPMSLDKYLYAENDPVDNIDPAGTAAMGAQINPVENPGYGSFYLNLDVGLVGDTTTPNLTINSQGCRFVDPLKPNQPQIPLQDGSVTVELYQAIPATRTPALGGGIGADICMVPNMYGKSDVKYEWVQWYRTDDPEKDLTTRDGTKIIADNHWHLDVTNHATEVWYGPPGEGSTPANYAGWCSGNAYVYGDQPNWYWPEAMAWDPKDPKFVNNDVHFDFRTELVELPADSDAGSGGKPVLDVRWGFGFNHYSNWLYPHQ